MTLTSDFQKLEVDSLITLYELDASAFGAGILRFHGHGLRSDWQNGETPDPNATQYDQDIIWQGESYSPVPITASGLEMRGDGKASSPRLSISNTINGQVGFVSALCANYDDFAGAKVRVIYTTARYLDAANFINGNPQASDERREQIWYIEQKVSENAASVTFELSNPVDFEGAQIPFREITSYCHWCVHGDYRGEECGYIGAAMFDEFGNPTDDPSKDKCGGRLSDCKIRFGENEPLRFGGFPSSSLIPT